MKKTISFLILCALLCALCACQLSSEGTSPDELWENLQAGNLHYIDWAPSLFDSYIMGLRDTAEADKPLLERICRLFAEHCQKPTWVSESDAKDAIYNTVWTSGAIETGDCAYMIYIMYDTKTIVIRQASGVDEEKHVVYTEDRSWIATFDQEFWDGMWEIWRESRANCSNIDISSDTSDVVDSATDTATDDSVNE